MSKLQTPSTMSRPKFKIRKVPPDRRLTEGAAMLVEGDGFIAVIADCSMLCSIKSFILHVSEAHLGGGS